jgi:hypothetical protein
MDDGFNGKIIGSFPQEAENARILGKDFGLLRA